MLSSEPEYTVYSIPGCPYCALVKHELRDKDMIEVVLHESVDRDRFRSKWNVNTFPQVFCGAEHIGGYEMTKAHLERNKQNERSE